MIRPDLSGTTFLPLGLRFMRYINTYRLIIALAFATISVVPSPSQVFGQDDPFAFRMAAILYFLTAIGFLFLQRFSRPSLRTQVSAQILTDIVLITALANASGGIISGLGLLLLAPMAAAGLVGQGRLALLFPSLASIAMLGMHSVRTLRWEALPQDYLQTALLCISYFAVASMAHVMAKRMQASEFAAREKSRELALVSRIHALATRDSSDGLLAVDAEGNIIYSNAQASKLLGVNAISSGGQLWAVSQFLNESIMSWKAKRGPSRILLDGSLVNARFLALDGTGHTLALLEDPARAEALAQQVKLAALGRLTLNVSHEIRNPLSAIGHAAQLLGEDETNPGARKLISIIQNNVFRLDKMVQDILALNQRDNVTQERLELSSFVKDCLEEWRMAEEVKESAVNINMPDQTHIRFAQHHLYQILWNLASNAWRHSRRQAGSVHVNLETNGGDVLLEVCDDGNGIDSEAQQRLFEPFYTTSSTGTGLGLYLARELASANHASLIFSGNRPGACFRLSMPLD